MSRNVSFDKQALVIALRRTLHAQGAALWAHESEVAEAARLPVDAFKAALGELSADGVVVYDAVNHFLTPIEAHRYPEENELVRTVDIRKPFAKL